MTVLDPASASVQTGEHSFRSTALQLLRGWPIRGHIAGLTLSNGTDATNDIDIAAGEAADTTTKALMVLDSAITKRLDAAWAAGTGNGGLDTGSIANTTYHVWLISKSSGVVDALFSASATAPTMPSGYTLKRRIGSIIRLAGTIIGFTQRADEFLWKEPGGAALAASLGTAALMATMIVPLGIKVDVIASIHVYDITPSGSVVSVLVTSPDQTDTAPTASIFTIRFLFNSAYMFGRWRTNTSGQIRYRLDTSAADIYFGYVTHGWIDSRGRDA